MIARLARLTALPTLAWLLLSGLPAQAASPRPVAGQADEAPTIPMAFTLVAAGPDCRGCVVINASGEITDDTARSFVRFVETLREDGVLPPRRDRGPSPGDPRVMVGFESVGGKVLPALVLGRRLRALGWTTVVGQATLQHGQGGGQVGFAPAGCYSACSMVMLGGVDRFVVPGSKPGIHQFSPQFQDGETFDTDEMTQIVRDYGRQVATVYDYTREMGAGPAFFVETMRTPFASMDVLPEAHWLDTGIATRLLAGHAGPTRVSEMMGPQDGDVPVAALLQPQKTLAGGTLPGVPGQESVAVTASFGVPARPKPASEGIPSGAPAVTPSAMAAPAKLAPAGLPAAGQRHSALDIGRDASVRPARWTVMRPAGAPPGAPAVAGFSDPAQALRVTVTCLAPQEARLDLTFVGLDPVASEKLRSAAESFRRLRVGARLVAITAVPGPVRAAEGRVDEQSVAALLSGPDLEALGGGAPARLGLAVLDGEGRAVARPAAVDGHGLGSALGAAMKGCGGA